MREFRGIQESAKACAWQRGDSLESQAEASSINCLRFFLYSVLGYQRKDLLLFKTIFRSTYLLKWSVSDIVQTSGKKIIRGWGDSSVSKGTVFKLEDINSDLQQPCDKPCSGTDGRDIRIPGAH